MGEPKAGVMMSWNVEEARRRNRKRAVVSPKSVNDG